MKIDIYNNLKSKRPFTSWRSLADMYNYLEVNRNIATVVKKYQETGDKSLKEVMNSTLFTALRSGDLLADDHKGGCVLYEKREQVQAILK